MLSCSGFADQMILYHPHEESVQWHHRPKQNVTWKSSSSSSSVGRTASGTIKASALSRGDGPASAAGGGVSAKSTSRGDGPASAAGGGVSAKSTAFEWITFSSSCLSSRTRLFLLPAKPSIFLHCFLSETVAPTYPYGTFTSGLNRDTKRRVSAQTQCPNFVLHRDEQDIG